MEKSFLLKGYDIAKIPYKTNFSLVSKSTFKIESTADTFVTPLSIEQLQSAVGGASAAEVPFFILGGGSNIVFPDEGYHGLLISTENLNHILMTDDTVEGFSEDTVFITCQSGTPMAAFVNFCTKHNISGCEQFAGLPGTIGGASYMNARCFDKSISDIIYEAEYIELQPHGKTRLKKISYNPEDWDYKRSPFQSTDNNLRKIITSITFKLQQKSSEAYAEIDSLCKKFINERVSKGHFKYPSAGSVFKNNRNFGKPSGQIIDEAGLKGYRIGGAQIAPFHGNFIINIDNAKSKDISDLVELTINTVKDKYNFTLEPEIIFLNN